MKKKAVSQAKWKEITDMIYDAVESDYWEGILSRKQVKIVVHNEKDPDFTGIMVHVDNISKGFGLNTDLKEIKNYLQIRLANPVPTECTQTLDDCCDTCPYKRGIAESRPTCSYYCYLGFWVDIDPDVDYLYNP